MRYLTCNASASSVKWAGSYWTLHRWSPMDWFLLKRDLLTRPWLDFYWTLFPVITHLFLINLWSAVNAFCYIPVNSWFSVLAHWRVCIEPRFWEIFHGRVYIETWSQVVAHSQGSSETCCWMSPVGGVILNSLSGNNHFNSDFLNCVLCVIMVPWLPSFTLCSTKQMLLRFTVIILFCRKLGQLRHPLMFRIRPAL